MNELRYALFAGSVYYPSGGFDDYIASADTQTDLVNHVTKMVERDDEDDPALYPFGWAHIVDLHEMRMVLQWSSWDNEWEVL